MAGIFSYSVNATIILGIEGSTARAKSGLGGPKSKLSMPDSHEETLINLIEWWPVAIRGQSQTEFSLCCKQGHVTYVESSSALESGYCLDCSDREHR